MVTKRLQYRYDAVGNKVGMTDADGGLFTYTYDVMRRLTGVTNPLGERTTYVYDLNGRRTSAQLANGTRTSYSYDQGSRVQQIHTLKSNNSTVAKFDYAYDDNGRRTSVLEADGSRVTWTYDGTSQVTSEWRTGTSPFRHTFVYDTRGNRTLKVEDGARTTLVYDAANQLSSSEDVGGTTNYTYDANGNQHVTVAPGGSRTTQIWDYENRLVKTLQPGGGVSTMAYDADGLRVRKETPSEAKLFVWDDQNYLAETDDSGVTEVAYTTEPSTYGSTISHRSGGATTTYHFDALAATRVLTNASETVLESYNYTAFGTILGTPTLLGPFLWGGMVGYYWDADLATQYIRARHYRPSIARWISLDPIGFAGGDANLFRYVGNNIVMLIDPSGQVVIQCEQQCGTDGKRLGVPQFKDVQCRGNADNCCRLSVGGLNRNNTYRDCYYTGTWKIKGAQPDVEAEPLCSRAPYTEMTGMDCVACCISQNDWTKQVGAVGILARPPFTLKYKQTAAFGYGRWRWYEFHPDSVMATGSYREVARRAGVQIGPKCTTALRVVGRAGYLLVIVEGAYDIGLISYCANACSDRPIKYPPWMLFPGAF